MSDFVWGLDLSTSHLEFACAPLDLLKSGAIEIETLRTDTETREGERLGLLDRQLRIYARQLAGRCPPVCVWVEQPSGRFIKPQLYYTAGVVQAALYETLACPVWTIPPKTWKQRTVGNGNASKAMVQAWLLERGIEFRDEHQADAASIALAGRAMFVNRSWGAAA